ncbi:BIR7A-like protein [Mya arenaria]|uniref:BIR7A-like protein n=1 Tax=Mya arenaria TaxID=6604 RepID=A0ABY7EFZ9_MYAAR|nr:baculoviral IAP repeat-containing protein 7-B-like [Mya arenaria]WAR07716.1 BIR7A-like protein [Mya arenaria]
MEGIRENQFDSHGANGNLKSNVLLYQGNETRHETFDDQMKNEWARFQSFNKFQGEMDASFVRLAQSGFFYNGEKDLMQCFSCGVKNNEWPMELPVDEIHKQLQPNCPFMNKLDKSNIPIHPGDCDSETETQKVPEESASGGPDDLVTGPEKHGIPVKDFESINNKQSYDALNNAQTGFPNTSEMERETVDSIYCERRETTPIPQSCAKYPDYVSNTDRMATFISWAFSHIITSNLLADAGLFYTGVADCVRCFSCGGGMRNWEAGDDPWIEHARWFPNCEYVQQKKGQSFIDSCRLVGAFGGSDDVYSNLQDFFQTQSNTDCDEDLLKELQDMGFSRSSIDNALYNLRRINSGPVQPDEALEYLLSSAQSPLSQQPLPEYHSQKSLTPPSEDDDHDEHGHSCKYKTEVLKSEVLLEESEINPNEVAKRLKYENEQLKQQMMCKVCMDKDACVVFLPCGHLVACVECASVLRKCAICRKVIKGTVRAYMS